MQNYLFSKNCLYTITILSILNFILAVISAVPCLMAGVMSMDSPKAQNSLVSHIVCRIILSFPVVCLVCAVVPQFIDKFSIFVAIFPIIEMTLFVSIIYLISFFKGQE